MHRVPTGPSSVKCLFSCHHSRGIIFRAGSIFKGLGVRLVGSYHRALFQCLPYQSEIEHWNCGTFSTQYCIMYENLRLYCQTSNWDCHLKASAWVALNQMWTYRSLKTIAHMLDLPDICPNFTKNIWRLYIGFHASHFYLLVYLAAICLSSD